MEILRDYNLKTLNTFGVDNKSKFFVEISNEQDLEDLIKREEFQKNERLFLGGGSNVLFTKDFEGIIVLNKLKGIEILEEDEEFVYIKSMGGEDWHDLVLFTVLRGYWGLENLSLIPGSVGASPIQNIGAYGVELKDVLFSLEAFDMTNGQKKIFTKDECELGYRTSIFKTSAKGKYFVSSITIKLSKKEKKNISYKILANYIEENKIEIKNPKDVSDAIIAIRKSKLPDPKIFGNAGSFFKNIVVSKNIAEQIQKKYGDMPTFEEDGNIKIPSGWLIEKCGPRQGGVSWKGYRSGNVGVHEKQALVLVNLGGAKGEEIKEFSDKIIESVFEKFGLKLEREVNLI